MVLIIKLVNKMRSTKPLCLIDHIENCRLKKKENRRLRLSICLCIMEMKLLTLQHFRQRGSKEAQSWKVTLDRWTCPGRDKWGSFHEPLNRRMGSGSFTSHGGVDSFPISLSLLPLKLSFSEPMRRFWLHLPIDLNHCVNVLPIRSEQ